MPSRQRHHLCGPRRAAALGTSLAALLLGGCALSLNPLNDPLLQPGASNGAQLIARLGPPSAIWPEADGGRSLQYATQPMGQTCLSLRLDAQDRLLHARDALAEAQRLQMREGMTTQEVSHLLCRERSRVFYAHSGEEVWDWNVAPDQSGYRLRFNVHFKNGRVLRTSQSMVFPSRFGPGD
jgi:hypothetical protein